MLDDMLEAKLINKGVSGNNSRDLVKRLEKDVLNEDIDQVNIMIGINDVWQRVKEGNEASWIYPGEYKSNLEYMIKNIQEKGSKVILMSPFYLDLNQEDSLRRLTNSYQSIMQGVAHEFGLEYIDIQASFDDYLGQNSVESISHDKIHVNEKGNQIIANTIYQALK